MPITPTGRQVMRSMQKQHGKKKGKQVFYASINAQTPGSAQWHKKGNPERTGAKAPTPKRMLMSRLKAQGMKMPTAISVKNFVGKANARKKIGQASNVLRKRRRRVRFRQTGR